MSRYPVKFGENDLPGQKEEQKQQMKLFESFTFLCIVLAVVCNLIDYSAG